MTEHEPLTRNVTAAVINSTITPHFTGGRRFGSWVRLHKAIGLIPKKYTPLQPVHVPLGITEDSKSLVIVVNRPPKAVTLMQLSKELPSTGNWKAHDPRHIHWRASILMRREAKFGLRFYLPMWVCEELSMPEEAYRPVPTATYWTIDGLPGGITWAAVEIPITTTADINDGNG